MWNSQKLTFYSQPKNVFLYYNVRPNKLEKEFTITLNMFASIFFYPFEGEKRRLPKKYSLKPKNKIFCGDIPQNLTKEPVQAISEKNVCTKFDENPLKTCSGNQNRRSFHNFCVWILAR